MPPPSSRMRNLRVWKSLRLPPSDTALDTFDELDIIGTKDMTSTNGSNASSKILTGTSAKLSKNALFAAGMNEEQATFISGLSNEQLQDLFKANSENRNKTATATSESETGGGVEVTTEQSRSIEEDNKRYIPLSTYHYDGPNKKACFTSMLFHY